MKKLGIAAVILALFLMIILGWLWSSRAGLIDRTQEVDSQAGTLAAAYQRRFDLVPNLAATVDNFMSRQNQIQTGVIELRQRVVQFKSSADSLLGVANSAMGTKNVLLLDSLSNLLSSKINSMINVVVERYPDIKGEQIYGDMMAQLEGTENRIIQERRTFNVKVMDYNKYRQKKLGAILAGGIFSFPYERQYFKAEEGAEKAPNVKKLFQ